MSGYDRMPPQQPQPQAQHQTPDHSGRSAAQPQQQAQPTQAAPKKRPEDTLRDGALKATIWKRQAESGDFYATELARTYKDQEGRLHDTHSFSGNDLLKVSELAKGAYHRTNELRREQAQERRAEAERTPEAETQRDERREAHREARKPRSRGSRRRGQER